MRTLRAVNAAGDTDPGLKREVNEDRFHFDVSRGLFIVIDGVGGQAAGGKAADVALSMLRTRLERETGAVVDRVREAITIANNEIHRVAQLRPEWSGMACVLTVVVVDDQRAIVGHVGDTRLYKIHRDRIEKVTHDHSPVGEREDSNEISEFAAMHHPRRNEVYRDVGSELHQLADPDFIEVHEIPFEPDAALLLCSDGLSDLIESSSISQVVRELAGQPRQVVKALIEAAKASGGKDNVTAVYVEGEQFAQFAPKGSSSAERRADRVPAGKLQLARQLALVTLLFLVIAFALFRQPWASLDWPAIPPSLSKAARTIVRPNTSIASVLERAEPGSEVVVEPGEYRERVVLRNGVRVVSRIPRSAIIRLPGTASEADPAVIAEGITGAEFVGFRIVGDASTPLGTGLLVRHSELSVVDVEVTGALNVAVDLSDGAHIGLVAGDIHDNPGAGLAVRSGASPRIAHNVFIRNGMSERVPAAVIVEADARPRFSGNVFHGISPRVFMTLSEAARTALVRDNWFLDSQDVRSAASPAPHRQRGR
jgi:serine/threonine protein phosphatase PrpC